MLFSNRPRVHYQNAPVHEVICQLRFPAILSINSEEPAEFQKAIRAEFPQYSQRQELPPPQIAGANQNVPPTNNYHFLSEDGSWKWNLTKDFIALSTLRYTGWEEFSKRLEKPLAAFIEIYQPSYFQRLGLRYLNLLSREKLGLKDTPWSELIAPAYIAPMLQEDIREENFLNCASDLLFKLDSSCQAKIHAGPGRVRVNAPNAPQDPEMKFILDLDFFLSGTNTPCELAAAAVETLHGHAGRTFEGAITDTLRDAMGPEDPKSKVIEIAK